MSTNATPVEAAPTAKPASPDLVPVGPSTDTAADVVGVGELLDARAAPRVLASAPTAERTLVRLQRTAGNRAVVDYLGRSRRLVGLLVDDTFGLATCPAATNMRYEVTFYCPQ